MDAAALRNQLFPVTCSLVFSSYSPLVLLSCCPAVRIQAEFDAQWDAAASKWEERWLTAFTPGNTHFSGHLPTVVSEQTPDLERIYYNALLTLISLERTNLQLMAPRVYLTSSGNALNYNCSTCFPKIGGKLEVGGAAIYYWDAAQISATLSLLDPVSFKAYLLFVLGQTLPDGTPAFMQSNAWTSLQTSCLARGMPSTRWSCSHRCGRTLLQRGTLHSCPLSLVS